MSIVLSMTFLAKPCLVNSSLTRATEACDLGTVFNTPRTDCYTDTLHAFKTTAAHYEPNSNASLQLVLDPLHISSISGVSCVERKQSVE